MILTANVDFNDLLITTDAVVSCTDTTWARQSSSCSNDSECLGALAQANPLT